MIFDKYLKDERIGQPRDNKTGHDKRDEFEKDYHRIIGSASFRRLQDKTQVFPLEKNDFIRTRLTHSIEVSSFGKSLGQLAGHKILNYCKDGILDESHIKSMSDILSCAGLIHDIGNPPFGHFGETIIGDWFKKNLTLIEFKNISLDKFLTERMCKDLEGFNGNAQSFRIITKLHHLRGEHGMNLTNALISTLIKYPRSSLQTDKEFEGVQYNKVGYFFADEDKYNQVKEDDLICRHPLTYLLEAADDIAYNTADIEDAIKKGILPFDVFRESLKTTKYADALSLEEESTYLMEAITLLDKELDYSKSLGIPSPALNAVQNWFIRVQGLLLGGASYSFSRNIHEIIKGKYPYDLFKGSYASNLIKTLQDISTNHIFNDPSILKLEIAASTILEFLLDKFVNAVLYYDITNDESDDKSYKMSKLDKKLVSIISKSYKKTYDTYSKDKSEKEKLYLRLLLVTDYISGMTDTYAKSLYQELKGIY